MQTEIHAFDPDTRTVGVTFTSGEIVHQRSVNACMKTNGDYDQAATEARIADVGRGVAAKIAVGAITNPPPVEMPEPEAAEEPAPAEDAASE